MINETIRNSKKIKIFPFVITNEILPQRVYPALLSPEIIPHFEITAFGGRPSKDKIIDRLDKEIDKREGYKKEWRSKHTKIEIASLHDFSNRIENGTPYFEIDDEKYTVPREVYESNDCVFIGTNNLTHDAYTADAVNNGKHFIVEKPYVVTKEGLKNVEDLEKLIEEKGLIGKVTAHFAHKPASLALFENIQGFVGEYGKINKISGFYEEFADPLKGRTIDTFDKNKSGGGICLDTLGHFEIILVALGAHIDLNGETFFEWDSYNGFNSETYAKVRHKIRDGNSFKDGAEAEIIVSKFADRYENPLNKEHKELILNFEGGHNANVLFSENKIEIKKNENLEKTILGNHPLNEYISVLEDFYKCILEGRESFTSTKVGIEAMNVILHLYDHYRNDKHKISKYRQNGA